MTNQKLAGLVGRSLHTVWAPQRGRSGYFHSLEVEPFWLQMPLSSFYGTNGALPPTLCPGFNVTSIFVHIPANFWKVNGTDHWSSNSVLMGGAVQPIVQLTHDYRTKNSVTSWGEVMWVCEKFLKSVWCYLCSATETNSYNRTAGRSWS